MLADPRRALQAAAVLVGVVWLPVIVLYGPSVHDLTYDDAWYYFQIGRNIADGAGSTFDGLHTTNGYHPLWMLVTAGVYATGLDDLAAVRTLLVVQLGLWVTSLLLLAQLAADAVGRWPAFAGRADEERAARRGNLLLAVVWFAAGANPYIFKLFVSGMETGIAALFGVGLLVLATRTDGDPIRRPVLAAALASGLFLSRTDSAFLVAALFLWTLLLRRRIDRQLAGAAAGIAAVVVAYLASNIALVGHPLQVSGVTKRVDPDAAGWLSLLALAGLAGLLLLAGRRARQARLSTRLPRLRTWFGTTAWWPAGTLLLLGYEWAFTSEIYLWHYAPQALWILATLPHAVADIYEGATIERPAEDAKASSRSWAVAAIIALPIVLGGLWQVTQFTHPELRSMQLGDRAAGEWVAANLPEGAVVGSFDAGVIGYFAERPVVNLDGLVNSFDWYDARHEGTEATSAFLRAAGVTAIANHGDPVDGDEPSIRASIDGLIGEPAGTDMALIHREDYVYKGTAGGVSGRRPYATFVWELPAPRGAVTDTGPETIAVPGAVVRLGRWLATVSPWSALALVLLIRAVTCGIWTVPSVGQWLAFTQDPYGPVELLPDFRYITGSPLGPLVAHTIGADTKLTYGLLHLGFVILAVAAMVAVGRRAVGDRTTTALVVLFFASPLSNILLTWLGQPDPIVFGGLTVIALASGIEADGPRRALVLTAGLTAGLASPEQALLALAGLAALAWWGDRPHDREVLVLAAAALVAGRFGVAAFTAASDAPSESRLDYIQRNGLGYFLRSLLDNLPAVIFSIAGAGWLLLGHAFGRVRTTFPNPWPVRLLLLLVFAAVATTYDQTRVAAMVSWPAAVWLVRRADEGEGLDRRIVAITAIAALVIPPIVIWEGEPYISAWSEIRGA